ncbi:DegT/DnrJ/EryC1/StrS family aminotransferase [Mongoliitalea lutea]|uniref:Pyridoxal phosphate-dependent aminotransferase n=1 Tax=Mongoliitalea lutea TaxID=849756 RepID=A0A8J3CWU9_9BACT|nr:DegT/DnrJ/EryC1/StrS family aminotransferase [Mongoliitalea lutea]GHB31314.1 pyridoxal phosphate-dependent aminotransferase [Mongoliitalea lutea]
MNKPEKIWLSSPHMGGSETTYVQEAFNLNWIAPTGPQLAKFEENLSTYANNQSVAALSSGTAGIHLGLKLLGVQADDYVICQSFTFSASANPIRYEGAIPVFVDSEDKTWNMCPVLLEEAIERCLSGEFLTGDGKRWTGPKKLPKAIIPVHLYGMPAQMEAIQKIANNYGIPIVEDAAEALGSTIAGQCCGSFGEIGVFSFNGNKIITTSGGGALTSKNPSMVDEAKFLATQARENTPHYEHKVIGYNYRLSNVSAAIGIGQLEVLPQRIEKRRANFEFYKEAFAGLEIQFLDEPMGYFSNRWLTTVLFDDAPQPLNTAVRLALDAHAIESRPLWKPMHLQPVFQSFPYVGNSFSEKLFKQGLCLPSGSNLTLDQLDRVASLVCSVCK